MERKLGRIKEFFYKNRAVALVVLVGVLLMLLPTGKTEAQQPQRQETVSEPRENLETRLEQILSQVSGAGNVRVLLTQERGETSVYQLDLQEVTDGDRREIRQDTITVTGSDRQQEGLLTQVEAPRYRGAVIVCQGGDNPTVRLSVVEAVSGATGLPSNRITVLKMK
ncbi:MAG: hypothetical protein PUD66_09900 [Oscillospiraceae bacterium]|nr:hypothetical protein [Oscillospiraceae bacterium]